jgi:hypothetical protein
MQAGLKSEDNLQCTIFNHKIMSAYLAKIVYQITCGHGRHAAQFDEQLRFVFAASESEALIKSKSIGLQEEDHFFNQQQQLVSWTFVGVTELYRLGELSDGAEVYSQIRETEDAASYISFAQHKATLLHRTNALTHL